jgi:hypothetical protein
MKNRLTPEEIEAALKMCEKATQAPWLVRTEGTLTARGPAVYAPGPYYDDDSEFVVAECGVTEIRPLTTRRWKRAPGAERIRDNAALIAIARDLLPRALRELQQRHEDTDRLEDELERERRSIGSAPPELSLFRRNQPITRYAIDADRANSPEIPESSKDRQ